VVKKEVLPRIVRSSFENEDNAKKDVVRSEEQKYWNHREILNAQQGW
jgi:hypothetical protein